MSEAKDDARERVARSPPNIAERGDSIGWFEALYKEAAGNTDVCRGPTSNPTSSLKHGLDKNG
jgi:hypothetical protein